jgi:hypothetical protein
MVVSTPLKNISRFGMIIPNLWKVIKFHGSKPPTRDIHLQGNFNRPQLLVAFGAEPLTNEDVYGPILLSRLQSGIPGGHHPK